MKPIVLLFVLLHSLAACDLPANRLVKLYLERALFSDYERKHRPDLVQGNRAETAVIESSIDRGSLAFRKLVENNLILLKAELARAETLGVSYKVKRKDLTVQIEELQKTLQSLPTEPKK